jgi:hypothetical protein
LKSAAEIPRSPPAWSWPETRVAAPAARAMCVAIVSTVDRHAKASSEKNLNRSDLFAVFHNADTPASR